MKVLITGGAGFLGQRLARRLLEAGRLAGPEGEQRIDSLVLLDLLPAAGVSDPRVRVVTGDVGDADLVDRLVDAETASVFHLAAVVSGQAEADFDLGMRINLDASRLLLETCRRRGHRPRVVFTSSVAVYGGSLPEVVTDATAVTPRSSYGMQKAVAELLLADYSRRGFVDGRVLRLPTISVRPGKPNQAASSFASGIIREPLNGEDATCPVAPDTRLWLLSPRRAVECLVRGHELDADRFPVSRVVNLPGVSVTVAEMVAALGEIAGPGVTARIRWERDATVERIVRSWPARWDATRAHALGFQGDADFDAIVRAYIQDELTACRAKRT